MNLRIFLLISGLSVINAQLNSYDITFQNTPGLTFRLQHQSGNTTHLSYSILRNSVVIHESAVYQSFGTSVSVTRNGSGYLLQGDASSLQLSIIEDSTSLALISVERKSISSWFMNDCVQLKSDEMSWYGGPEQKYQYWPVQKLSFGSYSYVTKEADSCAIAERYWLNSLGLFIYIDKEAPLFLSQTAYSNICFYTEKYDPYYTRRSTFEFNYKIGIASDAKKAHLQAVEHFLKKPSGYPDERMTTYPIWSTWAKYRRDIDENVILNYADLIIDNGFPNSQMDIDDMWETCYGSLQFNTTKFPNIKSLTDELKKKDFRITLWVHPFINKGCEPYYSEALSKGYFVLDHNNNPDVKWWNSAENGAAHIDFTKPEAAQWYADRLRALQTFSGIDSFKFDAGETSWAPSDPVLNATLDSQPNALTVDFVNTVVAFGRMIEVRTAHRQQNIPVFIRMLDKDSDWSWNNGLPTLVTTLLQFNMVGYPFVLPDMIGGNGYADNPISRTSRTTNKELYIRWLQANVFMPALQFSFVPWDFDNETIALSKKFISLHVQYADRIIQRFKLAVESGQPVNPPIWWISPHDKIAQSIDDQFMLGDDILVAPVLQEGKRARNIYLPEGKWFDPEGGRMHQGPAWLDNYSAPLDVLPYFIRSSSERLFALRASVIALFSLINLSFAKYFT